jgi:hypothetical protein
MSNTSSAGNGPTDGLSTSLTSIQHRLTSTAADLMVEDALARSRLFHQLNCIITAEGIRALSPAELGVFVAALEAWTGEPVPLPDSPPPATPPRQTTSSVASSLVPCVRETPAPASSAPLQFEPATPTPPAPRPKVNRTTNAKSETQPKTNARGMTGKAAFVGPNKTTGGRRKLSKAGQLNPDAGGDIDELADHDTTHSSPHATSKPRLLFAPHPASTPALACVETPRPSAPTWACVRSV